MNRLIDRACHLPTPKPELTVAYTPIRLPLPDRSPLELRLTCPAKGTNLPIVLFSHGYGPSNYIPSKDGYAPLAQFWAERGFAVIQPTHASSRLAGLGPDGPAAPFYWRERVSEIRAIIDGLVDVERQSPAVAGRLCHDKIAIAGHSFGGQTASLLLGARMQGEEFSDPRITAGILLAAPGRGGSDLTPESHARFPFFDLDFSTIRTPTLVVCGAEDNPHFTLRGPEWHADAFHDAPGANALVTISGVGHGLGGVAGLDAKETEVESPDALETTRRLTLAWIRRTFGIDPADWDNGLRALRCMRCAQAGGPSAEAGASGADGVPPTLPIDVVPPVAAKPSRTPPAWLDLTLSAAREATRFRGDAAADAPARATPPRPAATPAPPDTPIDPKV